MSASPPIATMKADIRKRPCLLYPRKRTCAVQAQMSAKGQKRTSTLTHHARHIVAAVDERCSRPVEAKCKLKAAALRGRQPVLALVDVLRLVVLQVDDEFAALGVQLAALEHVAVDRVTVDRIVDEIAIVAVEWQFPELGHRRHVVEIVGDGVAVLAGQWTALRVVEPQRAGMRAGRYGTENSDQPKSRAQRPIGVL